MGERGYSAGHPWYYVLGGKPPYPHQIMAEVQQRGYGGYLASEIARMDALPEPKRSQALRSARIKALADYRADLSRYREVVRALHRHRANHPHEEGPRCAGVHQSVSLKHNHLFNDLAHLRTLAVLLDKQRDLFDF
ncbi:hypothetical protein J3E64_001173 [Sphingobium sp. OAS761]|uniref:hypothetical protein n=1 Tax=Sphingobium sp. OAS761 TaxID=2817901 RepID=UPI00209F8266|nr:hypothetical protein [Sphingobium sp. OAS761]MCP1469498.1 hypothetical protein [Sphingobium sp. OAS761]